MCVCESGKQGVFSGCRRSLLGTPADGCPGPLPRAEGWIGKWGVVVGRAEQQPNCAGSHQDSGGR